MGYALEQSLNEAIKKHLPSQVADELKVFFEERDELAAERDDLEEKLENAKITIENLRKEVKKNGDLVKLRHKLSEREEEVLAREVSVNETGRLQAMHDLQTKLEASEKYSQNITDFMLNLSRNTTVRKSFVGTVMGTTRTTNGPNGEYTTESDIPVSLNRDETISEE